MSVGTHPLPVPEVADIVASVPIYPPAQRAFRRGARRSRRVPLVVAVASLLAIAAFRTVVIGIHGEPSGLDFGNWLMFGHQALGHPLPRSAHVTYPPVVPLLSVAFVNAFGVVWGTAVLAGLASILPAAGVYVTCRLFEPGWLATLAAVLVAANSSVGETAAWGGIPQLAGLGLAAVILGQAQRLLSGRRWRRALWLGVLLLAVAGTSHLILAQVVVILVVLVAIDVACHPSWFAPGTWWGRDGWLAATTLTLLPMVIVVPLYVRLLPGVGNSAVSSANFQVGWPAFVGFLRALDVVYRDVPWLWKSLLILTAATPILLMGRRSRAHPLWPVVNALVISLLAEAVISGQVRFVYLAPLAVGFAVVLWGSFLRDDTLTQSGQWFDRESKWKVLSVATLVMAAGLCAWTGLARFPAQRAFYGAVDRQGTVAGLDWLRAHTPPGALVAVAPVNGSPFGWWVQGYGQRSALVGSEDRWLNFPEERTRADEVTALFDAPDPLGTVVLAGAQRLGVQYLVIPWSWGGLSQADLAAHRLFQPGLVVYDNHAMVVARVP